MRTFITIVGRSMVMSERATESPIRWVSAICRPAACIYCLAEAVYLFALYVTVMVRLACGFEIAGISEQREIALVWPAMVNHRGYGDVACCLTPLA
jgi:hypothetical protein